MSRYYDTLFRDADTGNLVTVRAGGNTRRSAERWARRKLRDLKKDPKRHYVVRSMFVPEGDR